MRLLADLHIAPRTVQFLRQLGHDVVRVSEVAQPTLPDDGIVSLARQQRWAILTQDLDFSRIVALSGARVPSLLSLRLASSRLEHVHSVLAHALPGLEPAVVDGAIITIEEHRVRVRPLPLP
jgi:predicted nuclease of predicted toxin-antitoxin system